jgi:hypothetical protein
MDSNPLVRAIVLGLICFLASCSKDNASPKCDNEITLAGVKDALYRDIAQGGDQYRFERSLNFKDIETVEITEEGRVCTARLMLVNKYYLLIDYEIAADGEEYYVTYSGLTEGSKENIYKVVNNIPPDLGAGDTQE